MLGTQLVASGTEGQPCASWMVGVRLLNSDVSVETPGCLLWVEGELGWGQGGNTSVWVELGGACAVLGPW